MHFYLIYLIRIRNWQVTNWQLIPSVFGIIKWLWFFYNPDLNDCSLKSESKATNEMKLIRPRQVVRNGEFTLTIKQCCKLLYYVFKNSSIFIICRKLQYFLDFYIRHILVAFLPRQLSKKANPYFNLRLKTCLT